MKMEKNSKNIFWMSVFRIFSPASGFRFSRWGLFLACFTTHKVSRKLVSRGIEGYTFLQCRFSDPPPLIIELVLAECGNWILIGKEGWWILDRLYKNFVIEFRSGFCFLASESTLQQLACVSACPRWKETDLKLEKWARAKFRKFDHLGS